MIHKKDTKLNTAAKSLFKLFDEHDLNIDESIILLFSTLKTVMMLDPDEYEETIKKYPGLKQMLETHDQWDGVSQ